MSQRRYSTKTYQTQVELTCGGCKTPINAGGRYKKDRSGTPWHPACKRLGVRAQANERPRYQTGSPVGQDCQGCGTTINEDDSVIHVSAKPWHRECRKLYA